MEPNLSAFSSQLADLVARAAARVVAIEGGRQHPASGILWRPGLVVTAEHTLKRDDELHVTLNGGVRAPATVAGRDGGTDLAVIRIDSSHQPAASLPPLAPLEPAPGALAPGALAVVVGRSPANGPTATLGMVSIAGPAWRTWRGGSIENLIRLDAAMYPGSSGAGAFDAAGRLIGMATSGLSRFSAVAVPAAAIERVAAELIERGHVSRAFLGLGLQPIPLPESLCTQAGLEERSALIVLSLEPGGPAEAAGLLPGDILLRLDDKPLAAPEEVQQWLATRRPGDTVEVSMLRGGARAQARVTLGERGS